MMMERLLGVVSALAIIGVALLTSDLLLAQQPRIAQRPRVESWSVNGLRQNSQVEVSTQRDSDAKGNLVLQFNLVVDESENNGPHETHASSRRGTHRLASYIREPLVLAGWWEGHISKQTRDDANQNSIDLDSLIIAALQHSPRIRALSDQTIIRRQAIDEADAEFDTYAFMESKFDRASDPVGNTLTVGGNGSRFRQEDWRYSAGLRKRTRLGGSFEAAQEIGILHNNSQFLSPRQQGNARLTLNFKQPLLNGAGRAYNESLIVLADIDTRIAWDQTTSELQNHLLAVVEAYWELYMQRASLLQKHRHHERAKTILDELEARRGIDSLRSQIIRARAAVTTRRAELIRAATTIRNVESRIRSLVAAPDMISDRRAELLPIDVPAQTILKIDEEGSLTTALQHRPEIDEAMQRVKAAGVRLDMSKNELLPVLDAVVETYVSGLDGNYGIGQAWADQFSVGEPGYSAGLIFEIPLYNRAARARHKRRQVELRQLQSEFQDTIQKLSAEVEIAVREVRTAFGEMQSRHEAMKAADADVQYLKERWAKVPGEDRAATFLLEDLLDAQDRLSNEEFRFANAQRAYTVSLTVLRRATGTLLEHEKVAHYHGTEDCLPRVLFDKPTTDYEDLPVVDDERHPVP